MSREIQPHRQIYVTVQLGKNENDPERQKPYRGTKNRWTFCLSASYFYVGRLTDNSILWWIGPQTSSKKTAEKHQNGNPIVFKI